MSIPHRTSVICLGEEITGKCTCGKGVKLTAHNTPHDHLVIYKAYNATRQLMERHWWRMHGKPKLFGRNWKSVSPRVPPKFDRKGWV